MALFCLLLLPLGSVEINSFFIQGNATVSREVGVGIATPAINGNPGDIKFFSDPTSGGYVGWVFTTDNDWFRFGNVSLSKDANIALFDQVGIATTAVGSNELQIVLIFYYCCRWIVWYRRHKPCHQVGCLW